MPSESERVPCWDSSSYTVVSWLEMLQFSAKKWNLVIRDVELLSDPRSQAVEDSFKSGKHRINIALLQQVSKTCKQLELKFSAEYADSLVLSLQTGLDTIGGPHHRTVPSAIVQTLTCQIFCGHMLVLKKRIDDELHLIKFLKIELVDLDFFQKPRLFGDTVYDNFPSAREDIEESGNCLSLDRGTACVMHLCRVVEVGLRTLAVDEMNLTHRPDWGRHLKDISDELEKRYKVSGSRTKDEEFYAESANHIGHMKVAMRNPSMHVDRKYFPDEATGVLTSVKGFMKHLATKLKEPHEVSI